MNELFLRVGIKLLFAQIRQLDALVRRQGAYYNGNTIELESGAIRTASILPVVERPYDKS
jgi:hypothetical protein